MTKTKDQPDNRRNFLKKSLAGAAGLSVIPSLSGLNLKAADLKSSHDKGQAAREGGDNKIIYRTLGRTGIKVPIVSMGTSENEYILKAAYNKGIMHFDTANGYGNGVHEMILGRILEGKSRDSYVIGSKIYGLRDNATGMPLADITADDFKADFRQKMDQSLKRLKMDYVDIFYQHSVDNPEILKLDVIRDMSKEFKDTGKAKFLGVSTHTPEVVYAAVEEGIYDVILVSYNFRDEETGTVREAISYAAGEGCGIVGMKALAGIYWDRERKNPINAKAAAKWILQDENVHTTIFSMRSFDQLDMYWSLMDDLTLTPEERNDLHLGQVAGLTGMYCRSCRQCLPQCPYGVDIPKIMRSYMYAYGYREPSKARETMHMVDAGRIKCDECAVCDIECSMGFNIREKIRDIKRIMDVPGEFLV
jgi:predicted aldo/keto reductase-like oxidoreductase